MKISLTISSPGSKTAPIIFRGDYAEEIVRAATIGYKAVELHIRDPKAVDRKAILRSLEKTGMEVSTIGTGQAYGEDRIFFTSPDEWSPEGGHPTDQRPDRFRIRAWSQGDHRFDQGTPARVGTRKRALARKRAIDGLRECADYAQKARVSLPVEAINRYEANFLNTAEDTYRFVQEIGSSAVGLHLDTFHMNIEEVSIEEAIKRHADRLIHIHLADSNRWAPGMGHLNFHSILSTPEGDRIPGLPGTGMPAKA